MLRLPDPDALAEEFARAVQKYETPRDLQAKSGRVGVSDIGHCREYVRLMIVETPFSDDPPKFAAFVGTALDDRIQMVVQDMFPTAKRHMEVTVTLPSGLQVLGHPDLVLPNGVIDIKTVDGLTSVKRNGPSVTQQFQRHLYAAGLIQAGEIPEECWVGNVWFDRSARDYTPHVQLEPYDPLWLTWADEWLADVMYAVKHGERAMQDQPIEFCERFCEFYTVCRGEDVLRDREGGGKIEDPMLIDAVRMYVDARDSIKELERQKADAQRMLADISGVADDYMVKWVYVNPSEVPGYTRSGYAKLDIRKVPAPRSRNGRKKA